jgi:DNA helicase-2/ATP-dependent DNA helicase PcrA
MAAAVSAVKNGEPVTAIAARYGLTVEAIQAHLTAYDAVLRSRNALDLDDLLVMTVRALQVAEVQAACRAAHDEVLVDEYQDTNPVQREIIRLLQPESGSVVAVGDDDQAIYSWRQADPTSMLRFGEDFPGAATIPLDETYRSTKLILRAAQSLVRRNTRRIDKHLRTSRPAGVRPVCYAAGDERDEARWIATQIEHFSRVEGVQPHEIAVLYRTNAQSRVIEDALVRSGIPYDVYSGRRFYDRDEVLDAAAYLRLALAADDDEAAARLIGRLEGIGPRRLQAVRAAAATTGRSLTAVLAESGSLALPRGVIERLAALAERVERVRAQRSMAPPVLVDVAIEAVAGGLDDLTDSERESALETLVELRAIAAEVQAQRGTLPVFLQRLALAGDSGARQNGVHLMTLHAAKGLEFPVVFMPGLEEGLLPHRRSLDSPEALEEERRLCYVGMTRARDRLLLSYAQVRLIGGGALGARSRFIAEIGQANLVREGSRRELPPRLFDVRLCERVTHARWGSGTVEGVEGTGRNTLVTIRFDSGSRQRVQLCHAPLRRVREDLDVLAG